MYLVKHMEDDQVSYSLHREEPTSIVAQKIIPISETSPVLSAIAAAFKANRHVEVRTEIGTEIIQYIRGSTAWMNWKIMKASEIKEDFARKVGEVAENILRELDRNAVGEKFVLEQFQHYFKAAFFGIFDLSGCVEKMDAYESNGQDGDAKHEAVFLTRLIFVTMVKFAETMSDRMQGDVQLSIPALNREITQAMALQNIHRSQASLWFSVIDAFAVKLTSMSIMEFYSSKIPPAPSIEIETFGEWQDPAKARPKHGDTKVDVTYKCDTNGYRSICASRVEWDHEAAFFAGRVIKEWRYSQVKREDFCLTMKRPKVECGCPDCGSSIVQVTSGLSSADEANYKNQGYCIVREASPDNPIPRDGYYDLVFHDRTQVMGCVAADRIGWLEYQLTGMPIAAYRRCYFEKVKGDDRPATYEDGQGNHHSITPQTFVYYKIEGNVTGPSPAGRVDWVNATEFYPVF